jgi:hypothetical protein
LAVLAALGAAAAGGAALVVAVAPTAMVLAQAASNVARRVVATRFKFMAPFSKK